MTELFTTSSYLARIQAEMAKMEKSILKSPPATWDAFNRLVGEYAGLEKAAIAAQELENSLKLKEDEDADHGWGNKEPLNRTHKQNRR